MIVLCGVDEFPSGPRTEQLAASFADRIGAELRRVDGGPAAAHVAAVERASDGVLLFGHAPPRAVAAALRASPCPVVIAPAGIPVEDWDEVVLGSHGDAGTEEAAATAGVLAARLGAALRVVVVGRERRSTGWRTYDVIRRLTRTAEAAGGGEVEALEPEVREGRPADELLRAAGERDTPLVVVAADRRPSWLDVLRPSFTADLLHGSRGLVVVVPPPAPRTDQPQGVRGRQRRARA